MRIYTIFLLCVVFLSLMVEAKQKEKLLALYKEATKGLTKEEKKLFFRRLWRGIKRVGRGIIRGARKVISIASNPVIAKVAGMIHPGAATALRTVRRFGRVIRRRR
eukprot:TRINITY_DN1782_c0_g3_i12.p1 TRINITY_DN1782_c0_g3~~TRINITY_DN1782_c0_g3_i12.p1  ORF type:complete len:106 (+),score=4.70 TRINITY_DN1782_c0_g3_i12:220-537(+)